MAGPVATSGVILDVNEVTFERDVIQRSQQTPVVVDFWAAWCGPCRSLGPILEGLAEEYGGRFILARLDVDANQRLAAQYNIQGIPAVKAFKGGRVAAEFVGALPRPAVRQFIDKLLPDGAESKVNEGLALLSSQQHKAAERVFRDVLATNADQPAALLGLARTQLAQNQEDMALETLDRVPPATPEGAEAGHLRAEISLRKEVGRIDEAELRACLAETPGDLETRYRLASLLTLQQRYEEALEEFLAIVGRDRHFHEDGARKRMLYIFDLLGDAPLVRSYRNKLASTLFA